MSAKRAVIPVFIPHLGCPHRCVFCDQRRISGSFSVPGPEQVRQAVDKALERLPKDTAPELAFYGGSFTAIPASRQEALLSAAQPYLREGKLCSLRVSTRPDAVSPETLTRLNAYGVRTVELGAQSMDEQVLLLSGRGHTAEQTRQAARLVREAGFSLVLQMMTGLPGSSRESDIGTARELIALLPDAVRLYPTVILRGTELFERWQSGAYREHTVEDAVALCAHLLPLFEEAGIPVIRLGLNPTEELSHGEAVGGAYHPALGELVKSRVLLGRVIERLPAPGEETEGKRLLITVHPAELSPMIGQHRANAETLRKGYGFSEVKVVPGEAEKGRPVFRICG